jgi:hypothetical protein
MVLMTGVGDCSVDRRGMGNRIGGMIRDWDSSCTVGRIGAPGV